LNRGSKGFIACNPDPSKSVFGTVFGLAVGLGQPVATLGSMERAAIGVKPVAVSLPMTTLVISRHFWWLGL